MGDVAFILGYSAGAMVVAIGLGMGFRIGCHFADALLSWWGSW